MATNPNPGNALARNLTNTGRPIDPYLIWAVLTDFAFYAEPARSVAFIGELASEKQVSDINGLAMEGSLVQYATRQLVEPLYLPTTGNAISSRYCVVRIQLNKRSQNSSTTWKRVQCIADLLSVFDRLELAAAVEAKDSKTGIRRLKKYQPIGEPVALNWIGLIDDFVGFAHSSLHEKPVTLRKPTTRVKYVWNQDWLVKDQGPVASGSWRFPSDVGRGSEIVPAMAGDLVNSYPRYRRAWSHGSHVAGLAAGSLNRLPSASFQGDAASKAPIIAVHLPRKSLQDTSGGSLSAQVLDGLRYILKRVGDKGRAVVNVSYSTNAGPHDGTSILEMAMDDLVTQKGRDNLAIVLPAGNQFEDRCHARFDLERDTEQTLNWRILPDDTKPNFLEIWTHEDEVEASHLALDVTPPGRLPIQLSATQTWVDDSTPGQGPTVTIVKLAEVANSTMGRMILVAIGPTRLRGASRTIHGAPMVAAQHGVWKVTLKSSAKKNVEVRAWVERNDSLMNAPSGGRQSYLIDEHYERAGRKPGTPKDNPASLVKRAGSFNTIATGAEPVVVGGYVGDAGQPRAVRLASYTGGGGMSPLGANAGPYLIARSDDSLVRYGILSAMVRGAGVVRMSGTSVSAPQVTRVIYNQMVTGGTGTPSAKPIPGFNFFPRPPAGDRRGVGAVL